MWIFTEEGFFSAVQHFENPDLVVVRARHRDDIPKMLEVVNLNKKKKQQFTPHNDYAYRVVLKKDTWALYVAKAAIGIDYTNFKGRVRAGAGARSAAYHRVWAEMLTWQDKVLGVLHKRFRGGGFHGF